MRREKYKVIYNAELKSRLNSDTIKGNVVNEQTIDGKMFWVVAPANRPNSRLLYSKDAYTLMRKM